MAERRAAYKSSLSFNLKWIAIFALYNLQKNAEQM